MSCQLKTIKRRKDFKAVFKNSIVVTTDYVKCFAAPSVDGFKFAVGVRKHEACAVLRNRIKRRMRAALQSAGSLPEMHVIIHGRQNIVNMPFIDLQETLRECMKNIALKA